MIKNLYNLEKINEYFGKFATGIVKFRWLVIILILGLMIGGGIGLTKLKIGISLDNFFLKDDPVMQSKRAFNKTFGNNHFLGVLVEADDVFSLEVLKLIRKIGTDLKKNAPFADDLISLTDFHYIAPMGTKIEISKYKLSQVAHRLEDLRKLFDNRKNIKGKLYSEDYKQTWIMVPLKEYPDMSNWDKKEEPVMYAGKIAYQIIQKYKAEAKAKGIRITQAGIPFIAHRKNVEMLEEMKRVVLLASIIALIFIIIMIRFPRGVLGTIIVIVSSTLCVLGAKGWLGIAADTTFMLVPILLTIAISIGYTVHITSFFKRYLKKTGNRKEAVIYAITETGWPILFTAFTTIISLLSFLLVPIQIIRIVGVTSALSILIVYLTSMLFYTSFIATGKDKEPDSGYNFEVGDKLEKRFAGLSVWTIKHGPVVSIVFAIFMIAMIFGISLVKVNLNTRKMFGTKLQHIRDEIHVSEAKIGSIYSYDLMLDFNKKDEATKYQVLKKVEELIAYINKNSLVKKTTSLCEKVKDYNQAQNFDEKQYHYIPKNKYALNYLISKYEENSKNQARKWLNQDHSVLRLFIERKDYTAKEFLKHKEELTAKINSLFPIKEYPGFKHGIVGNIVQFSIMNQYITVGLLRSFGFAILIVTILMIVVFGSFKLGLIAMIPNISPALVAGGLMGFMGAPLEFVTMTIAPMVLGLAVDDTIHFLNHAKLEYTRTKDYNLSIQNTFISVGKAITQTTLILCGTFLAFLTAKVDNMVNMGIFTVAAIFSALIADFFVTPILLKISRPFSGNVKASPYDELEN